MAESLFLFGSDNALKKIESSQFSSEDEFQKPLAQFPDLLTDADFGESTPRRWMLVMREAPVADSEEGSGRWSLDHLFLDQDAVPTLVEVKRASDTRARREVVAQMLDYAANAASWWKVEDLERLFAKSCEEAGISQQAKLAKLLRTDEPDAEAFWRLWLRVPMRPGRQQKSKGGSSKKHRTTRTLSGRLVSRGSFCSARDSTSGPAIH
jgi:hypothetical protein